MAMRSSKLASHPSSCVVAWVRAVDPPAASASASAPSVPSHPLDVQSPKGSCPSSSPGRPPVAREAPQVANDRIAPLLADVDASAPESARSAAARNIAAARVALTRSSMEGCPLAGVHEAAKIWRGQKKGIQFRTQFATQRARWRGSAERS